MLTTILIIWPLLAAFAVLFSAPSGAKKIAFGASLVEVAIALYAAFTLSFQSGEVMDAVSLGWIPTLGINYAVGMDGISMLLVLLTTALVPLIIQSSSSSDRPKWFFALVLFMQMALVGVFTALDGFLFYIFWELALIPIYFICLGWGAEGRERITFKFFLYTLAGSLIMLVALVYLYLQTPGEHSFSLQALMEAGHAQSSDIQSFLFWGLFLAFAVKIPIFPFHTWQPDTYTNAPTAGTMLLSGIMLKMGIYGLIRWLLPIVPEGVAEWSNTAIVLCIIGIIYASMIAMVQKDMKRLIAYSSIAHVGLIAAGCFALNAQGMQGAMMQMLSHGINVVGLFYIVYLIEQRTGTRMLDVLGGVRNIAPVFATVFMIIMLGSVALPMTNGFVGEFLLINGVFQVSGVYAAFAGLTIILGAVYMLSAYRQSMLGEVQGLTQNFPELSGSEKWILYPVVALILFFGIYPKPLLDMSAPAVEMLLQNCKPGALITLN
jgi:NADH-quinone oxidoreductase subunit M